MFLEQVYGNIGVEFARRVYKPVVENNIADVKTW